ncbi:transporter substrate-binding domain-containing protein [Streptomyces sp. BF23-18]|uniref:transporter substrate-binding domain-containing protein n=1 Tax=Streptomyces sp. BF23-18 TaxID=3240282 RepID=UPI0034E5E3B0
MTTHAARVRGFTVARHLTALGAMTGAAALALTGCGGQTPENKDRQEGLDPSTGEKIGEDVDFVDYFTAGSSIMVKKGNPEGVKSPADLCGEKVAVQSGSTAYDLLQSQKCDEPIDIEAYDTHDEAQARLKAGAVVADVADYPVVAYAAQTSGDGKDFEVVGEQIGAGPYGIAVPSSNTELRDALQAALDAAVRDGSYGKVLTKWNVREGEMTDATINSGT